MVKAPAEKQAKIAPILGVIIKPVVSEKAAVKQSANNVYSFYVKLNANKAEISKEITKKYGVEPVSVNIVRIKGKTKRTKFGFGKRSNIKKAYVTLPKGKTIVVHENV